jgi:multidrug efflux pump subunit AcrB
VFSRFFIDRPIFASVLSIIITLIGGLSLLSLPLAQFPRIAPPTVSVTCNYPGANANDVAASVAAPIEQFVNGVEGMMYMSSQCTNDGTYSLTVTFQQDVNLNMAQVLVQNRINLALPLLPQVIKTTGITTRKRSPDILLVACVVSPNGRYDQLYLSNYALRSVRDEISRVDGVSDCFLFGQRDYSMRLWLDPDKLAYRNMTANDVVVALREQNQQISTGSFGQSPTIKGQQTQITLDVIGRLKDPEQFKNIVLKVQEDERVVRVKDVARVEFGAKNLDVNQFLDSKPCIGLAIFQLPDANALDTAERVINKLEELKRNFPEDVDYVISFDTTPYTRECIHEVFKTLRDAVILVALVVLTFLQNWRSAVIPLIAVPVAIIGTFAVMAALGFSLNNLTLFGLVLAIGIVVDDAIVVVEAVEHHIEHGMNPRDATVLAMEQVSGPVIAVGLVLSAVFVPCAFISGITGSFFRQFALTIAVSTIISAFNSLTLSPALTAMLLRPVRKDRAAPPPLPQWAFWPLGGLLGWLLLTPLVEMGWVHVKPFVPEEMASATEWLIPGLAILVGTVVGLLLSKKLNRSLAYLFGNFNRGFTKMTTGYTSVVGKLLHGSGVVLALYVGLVILTVIGFVSSPKGFIPAQDMGRLLINVQLPDSSAVERTNEVMLKATDIILAHPALDHVTAVAGFSFALNAYGSNFGAMFLGIKEFSKRRDAKFHTDRIADDLTKAFAEQIPEASIQIFAPPPVAGVGRAGGWAFVVEDRGDAGAPELQKQTENLVNLAGAKKGLVRVFTIFRANVPQLMIEPDLRECLSKGVDVKEFTDTLSIYQGSLYVNDMNLFGRTWQVNVQSDADFRYRIETLSRLKARNRQGDMVPLGALASVKPITGPLILNRYNMYPAATIQGATTAELSSREGIDQMIELAKQELPQSMAYEWTDMSYLELQAGNTAMGIFAFAVLMVFLVLAAQYESWSLPLAVILVVPLCLLCAIVGVRLAGMDINIFTQVGFVVLVGLSSKNAILIVEFAKMQREEGIAPLEATLNACRLRLRPIIMTSMAFILGVVPLMLSEGAGAEMRRTLGTAVFSGMLGVTLFGIFMTPVFFYVINQLGNSPAMRSKFMVEMNRASLKVFLAVTLGWAYLIMHGIREMTAYVRKHDR